MACTQHAQSIYSITCFISESAACQQDTFNNSRRGETHIYISQGAIELLKNNGKHTCTDRNPLSHAL